MQSQDLKDVTLTEFVPKTVQLCCTISAETKQLLIDLAEKNQRTLSQMASMVITTGLKEKTRKKNAKGNS